MTEIRPIKEIFNPEDTIHFLHERYNIAPESIDLKRVKDFVVKMGFRLPKIYYIPESKKIELKEQLDSRYEYYLDDLYATYDTQMDFIAVFIDDIFIEKNGAAVTESMIIHEYAHANLGFIKVDESNQISELGLTGKHGKTTGTYENLIIEEAYADYYRGLYMKENLHRRKLLLRENNPDFEFQVTEGDSKIKAKVRNKYLYIYKGKASYNSSTVAANALENLINKHPSLISYFNLVRTFPSLRKGLAANFNRLFPNTENAFDTIAYIEHRREDSGCQFYSAVQKILDNETKNTLNLPT